MTQAAKEKKVTALDTPPAHKYTRKITQIRCHIAVEIPGIVVNGLNCERHKVTMEMWPIGVYIVHEKGHLLVTYNNIKQIDFDPTDK